MTVVEGAGLHPRREGEARGHRTQDTGLASSCEHETRGEMRPGQGHDRLRQKLSSPPRRTSCNTALFSRFKNGLAPAAGGEGGRERKREHDREIGLPCQQVLPTTVSLQSSSSFL